MDKNTLKKLIENNKTNDFIETVKGDLTEQKELAVELLKTSVFEKIQEDVARNPGHYQMKNDHSCAEIEDYPDYNQDAYNNGELDDYEDEDELSEHIIIKESSTVIPMIQKNMRKDSYILELLNGETVEMNDELSKTILSYFSRLKGSAKNKYEEILSKSRKSFMLALDKALMS